MRLRQLWPHVPLALLVVTSGALNVAGGLGHLPLHVHALAEATAYTSALGVFGKSTQAVLGAALILCGFGLLWRLRTPWAFTLLLGVLTIAVDVLRREYGAALVVPAIIVVGLFFYRASFQRRAIAANLFVSILSIAAVTGYGTFGAWYLGDGFRPPIHNIATALYFTVITLATVGYGDIVPVTTETRMFAISLVIFGLAIFATAVATTFGPAITTEIGRIFSGKEPQMEQADHVIVVGGGDIADHTAHALEQAGNRISRIENANSGMDPEVLEEAAVRRARMVVAADTDDNKNAMVALIVKDLNPRVRVVAVAGSRDGIRRLKLAHADAVFAPSVLGGRLLAQIAAGEDIPAEYRDLLSV